MGLGCWLLRVLGLGFWVWGLRFKVLVLEFTALGLGFVFWVPGLGFGVLFYGFRIEGLRFFGIGLWV